MTSLSTVLLHQFRGSLGSLDATLDKVEAHEGGQSLIEASLREEMFNLGQQVQAATDTIRRVADRLSGREPSSRPDPEPTIDALRARIAETRAGLDDADGDKIDATADETITVNLGREMTMTGKQYALGFAIPNVGFHVAMAYAIARHHGVPLGKRDFITSYLAG